MTITYASTFTGIGGFECAFDRLGMRGAGMCEIERNRHPALSEHWPQTKIMEDIRDVSGTDFGPAQLYVGGFPCKDISRGKAYRKGLAGEHSRLFFEFVRLVEESARLIDEVNPRWVVLENSVDLLKSNGGRDLATVVHHLEDLRYGWAFRVVDARGFGTPQRRRRILVVAHRGDDPRPAGQVLGLVGPGSEAAAPSDGGRREPGPGTGPLVVGGSIVRVWRKGARSRVAIGLPGFRETWVDDEAANTLTANDAGPSATRQTHLITQSGRVRSLSPIEWERLQGFPDDWTARMPLSARYDALGNAMHVGVASWLGRRLLDVHNSLPWFPPTCTAGTSTWASRSASTRTSSPTC